jgi:hypothetical protein
MPHHHIETPLHFIRHIPQCMRQAEWSHVGLLNHDRLMCSTPSPYLTIHDTVDISFANEPVITIAGVEAPCRNHIPSPGRIDD